MGVGEYIRTSLKNGLDNDKILEGIRSHYPGSKATAKDIAWHRNKLKKEGDPTPLEAAINKAKAADTSGTRQPTMSKRVVEDREFDQTSLRASAHGEWVHRDYAAHFFRWGFAGRFIDGNKTVLDVGCGPDVPMMKILTMPRNVVPKRYVGVDYNPQPRRHPTRGWGTLYWNTDFIRDHKGILGTERFDVITNFEVIEHMKKTDGEKLLVAMREHLAQDGTILLSTPVFSGKAAANHIHEWTVQEMQNAVKKAKLRVEKRFGTFARFPAIKKVATKAEMELYNRIAEYYGGEVMACFLAPLYPDHSSNNIWLLKHA